MSGHTLRSLLTTDPPTIAGTTLSAPAPAALYTAFVTDRAAFRLFAITNAQVDHLPVVVEEEAEPGHEVTVTLAGVLRYLLTDDFEDPIERLCLTPGCDETRLGHLAATAFCDLHITRGESSGARLATLAEEARNIRAEGEGLGRVAEHLRRNLDEDHTLEERPMPTTAAQIRALHRDPNQAATIDRGEGQASLTKADILAAIDSFIEAGGEVGQNGEPVGEGWEAIADQLNS